MSDLTPIESRELHRELPRLRDACDPALALECFKNSLLFRGTGRFTPARCELRRRIYVPGQGCILHYGIEIHDREAGTTISALVVGRVFPGEDASREYAGRLGPLRSLAMGRREMAPFTESVGVIPALHAAVSVFPIDGELPALVCATDERGMAKIVGALLPDAGGHRDRVEISRLDVVGYGRRHRATLRYVLSETRKGAGSSMRTVFGKLTADGSGACAGRITAALRRRAALAESYFHVPECLGWVPDVQLSLLAAIPGQAVIGQSMKARLRGKPEPAALTLEAMVDASAAIAAAVHTTRELSGTGPLRTVQGELEWLALRIQEVRRISPGLAARLDPWPRRISALTSAKSVSTGPCHGDFTVGQILFEGAESGLVDFDSFCEAEPALDLGHFLAYLQLSALSARAGPRGELARGLGRRFLEAYRARLCGTGDIGPLAERADAYRTISLLRRTIRSWQKFRPERVELALAALEQTG